MRGGGKEWMYGFVEGGVGNGVRGLEKVHEGGGLRGNPAASGWYDRVSRGVVVE